MSDVPPPPPPPPPIDYDTAAHFLCKTALNRPPHTNDQAAKAVCLTTMCARFPGFHPDVTVVDWERNLYREKPFINAACHRGDLQTARCLFFLGAALCNRDPRHRTLPIILCSALSPQTLLPERQQLLQTLLSKPEVRRLIDAQDRCGNTALHHASPGLVEPLLAAGASLKRTNIRGNNAFMHAATECNATKLSLLLETGTIDVNEKFECGIPPPFRDSALQVVCRNKGQNDTAALVASARVLIEAGAALNSSRYACITPLHWAVFYGPVALVSLLIDHGADTSGTNLMAYACHDRHSSNVTQNSLDDLKDIIPRLLAANVSIDARDSDGMTPLMGTSLIGVAILLVLHGANVNAVSFGCSSANGMSVLMHACSGRGSLDVVEFLAERVADIDAAVATDASLCDNNTNRGRTALHYACAAPDTAYERVVVLLAAGATPGVASLLDFAAKKAPFNAFKRLFVAVSESGCLLVDGLLHACASRRCYGPFGSVEGCKIVEFLLKHPHFDTRVDALDIIGRTPLSLTSDVGIAARLVAAGADVNAVEPDFGDSVLMCNGRNVAMMRFLLSCKDIDVNAGHSICWPCDIDKVTALHRAVNNCGGDTVKLLIEAGANVNAADSLGDTPLHIAASNSETPSAEYLIKAGASLTFLNNLGKTPVDCIADKSSPLFYQLKHETSIAKKVYALGKWRPSQDYRFPPQLRAAIRTLVVIARACPRMTRARITDAILARKIPDKYPTAELCRLPDELLQYMLSLLATAPITSEWLNDQASDESDGGEIDSGHGSDI